MTITTQIRHRDAKIRPAVIVVLIVVVRCRRGGKAGLQVLQNKDQISTIEGIATYSKSLVCSLIFIRIHGVLSSGIVVHVGCRDM